ncbi:MAG TPA: hypothetical protein PK072_02970, partial [Quisquiliibacterium sp.]|nr:hypothetical protein [Quisquiliibacterium sp.]
MQPPGQSRAAAGSATEIARGTPEARALSGTIAGRTRTAVTETATTRAEALAGGPAEAVATIAEAVATVTEGVATIAETRVAAVGVRVAAIAEAPA